jgi:LysM repeat protein
MRRFVIVIGLLAMLLLAVTVVTAQSEIAHVVQYGENLFRISLRYGVPMNTIAARNNIANVNLIFAGQTLYIPTGGATTPTPVPTTPPGEETQYTVRPGDTLSRIARQFNTTTTAIAQRNNIVNPNLIFVGQVLIIPGSGPIQPTPVPTGTVQPPPQTGFNLGGHVFSFAFPDQMSGAGMTWAKTQIRWNQGEPASIAQGAIDAARTRGFKIMLGVVGNPSQLAANPTQYYQDFANFLGGVAALGADGIEVWNEMNIDREWPSGLISGAQYTQMLSAAYQAIKSRNPNTIVISGAPAPTGFFGGCSTSGCDDDRFIAQMAAAGASNYMDCVGVHYNAGITSPYATSGAPVDSNWHYSWYFPSMTSLYSSTFPGKPLCYTELGYLTGEGIGTLPDGFSWASGNTLADQAQWLADAVRIARSGTTINTIIVWNIDSTTWGADPQQGYAIIRPDGTCPACNSLAAAMR